MRIDKVTLAIILLTLLPIGGIFLLAKNQGGGSSSGMVAEVKGVTAEPEVLDLGVVSMKEGIVQEEVKLSNETGKDLEVTKVETSCMCTEAALVVKGEQSPFFGMAGHGINAGWVRKVTVGAGFLALVRYDPNAHGPAGVGKIERSIRIFFRDGYKTLTLRVEVVP